MRKLVVLLILGLAIAAYFYFDGQQYLSVGIFQGLYQQQPWLTALIYFAVYLLVAGLSLPGAAVLTIIGGMIFGFWTGLVLVSFASSIGATLAFFVSRFILRDWVQNKFAQYLGSINQGMEKQGAFYLFSLRLIPLFPFWAINLVMGLTIIPGTTFYWVSQLGMLAGTAVFVNAGVSLGAVEEFSTAGILTPDLILSFALLAAFPFIARHFIGALQRRRGLRGHYRPKQFDANLLVVGAGSAGLVSAYIAATVKAKVMLVEKASMGGDCLNTGCVPSKALIRAAKSVKDIETAGQFGVQVGSPNVDFAKVMRRVQEVITEIEPHDSIERFTNLGVDCIQGNARLLSPWKVDIDGRVISAEKIILATGASPIVPAIPGIDQVEPLTSENLWQLQELPERLLIMGGGAIGCELAQAFQRLGAQVTLVDAMSQLLPREDTDIVARLTQQLTDEGVRVLVDYAVTSFNRQPSGHIAVLSRSGANTINVEFDRVLVAVGRRANTAGFGLQELGVELNADGTVVVDSYLRTSCPTIFACGDVAGPYQLTHAAGHQAWFAGVNALFGQFKKFAVNYKVMPQTIYTDPQLARVGLNELEAAEQGIEVEVTEYDLADLDRAIADGNANGVVKVLTAPGTDRILGATILGPQAGELLTEFVTAIKFNLGLNKILSTIHSYPTLSEANKYVAGEWKRKHVPERLLLWVEKYYRWKLGKP
ncbi:MAG: FAD-dependent oxidoreductase [Porticoccaceae bacterium]|jgi:dihydrolipoamide dehydrogenase|nr:FAD-dependent oxidoreductase [Porticoccaceae bacterium]MDB2533310.1 FAD-dependent oxidoreductase [Porticoccaceae bacterium]